MRVLFLLDNFDDGSAQGEFLYRLCQRLTPVREITISTLAIGEDGALKDRLASFGIHGRALGMKGVFDYKKIRAEGARILFRADRPDIVHSLGSWPDICPRIFHSAREDVPYFTSVLDLDFCCEGRRHDNFFWRMGEKWTRKGVSGVISCGAWQEEQLKSRGIPEDLIVRIPPGIDGVQCYPVSESTKSQFRKLSGVADDDPLILCASRLIPSQGLRTILNAMKIIVDDLPSAKLFLIGDGPRREELEKIVRDHGLEKNVRIIGSLSSVLAKLFSSADVVIQGATNEAFPLYVAECFAAGTPVVAANYGGNPELVTDSETGLLYPPGNSQALAEHVLILLDDWDLRTDMGRVAREHVLSKFEITDTAENYIQLWRDHAPEAQWLTTTSLHIEELDEIKSQVLGE